MHDVHQAGGVPAIINELMKKDGTLHPDRLTVTGKTLERTMKVKKLKFRCHSSFRSTIRSSRWPFNSLWQYSA